MLLMPKNVFTQGTDFQGFFKTTTEIQDLFKIVQTMI